MSEKIRRVLVVGGTVVEPREGGYYAKASFAEYLHELGERFDEVVFATLDEPGERFVTRLSPDRVRVQILGPSAARGWSSTLRFLRAVRGVLRSLGPDWGVIITGPNASTLWQVLWSRARAGRVLLYLGSDPKQLLRAQEEGWSGRVRYLILRLGFGLSARLADDVLCRGDAIQAQAIRWNPRALPSRPRVAFEAFRKGLASLSEVGYRPARAEPPFRVLYVGKVDRSKGALILLEAFARLTLEGVDAVLTYVGDGDATDAVVEGTMRHEAGDRVRVRGWVDDQAGLVEAFFEADVAVIPSTVLEGYPRVADEAMGCGLPLICSRVGGLASSLDEDDVMFVEPGDVADLAAALSRLARDLELRETLSRRGVARARPIFEVTAAEQHAAILTSARSSRGDDKTRTPRTTQTGRPMRDSVTRRL